MSQHDKQPRRTIYTVGHSNHPLEALLDLLRMHAIEVLADTRSAPYSRYASHFNKDEFRTSLAPTGIKYLFLGRELGGRPDGDEYYDDEGRVDYARVAASPIFLEGIARVEQGIETYRVALLCSEENPATCHRSLLVARVLVERGIEVQHIRGDGSLQAHDDEESGDEQLSLFGEETREWKSIQPVSQRRPLTGSLVH